MEGRLSVEAAKDRFLEVVDAVSRGGEPIVIESAGKTVAAVVSAADFGRLQELSRRELFDLIADIHRRNQDLDPDEVMREVTAVVEEVRQAEYERRRRAEDSR
jgi:prevent-host-death family protein